MTRKHYRLLALAFRSTRPATLDAPEYTQWLSDVNAVAEQLSDDNPRFLPERFFDACGVGIY